MTLDGAPLRHTFEPKASGCFGTDLRRWMPRSLALRLYRLVYLTYWLAGDMGFLRRTRFGHRAVSRSAAFVPFPLPGWYDTHARLAQHLR
jgi:hypothetical protein